MKGKKCSGGKHNKERLTGLAAANALGEKLPIFVIGKSGKSMCFKHVKQLHCRYRSQKKSWMDSLLFEEWIKEVDKEMENEGRNIAMIIDNCPAHPDVDGLKAVELERLPPNTTSHTQPMDQGVIRSVKAKYRHLSVKRIIRTIEKNGSLPTTSLLDAMTMLARAWDTVEEKTIMNCFRKAGISPGTQTSAINDDDDPFRDIENDPFSNLQYDLNVLRESQPELVPDDSTAADLVDVDTNVMTNGEHLTDAEIIAEILNNGEQEEEDAETIVEVDDELTFGNSLHFISIILTKKFSANIKDISVFYMHILRNEYTRHPQRTPLTL